MNIKFSIITVCFNEINAIQKCINSVITQTYPHIEHIVIDGGSKDGTAEYLNSVKNKLSYFISESDRGIYDAMNKGLQKAKGDVFYFLNANDSFFNDDVIRNVNQIFAENPYADVVHGRIAFCSSPEARPIIKGDDYFYFNSLNGFFRKSLQQQCFFFRKEIFHNIGLFNEKFKICADYEWTVKALNAGYKFVYTQDIFCFFDTTGISSTQKTKRLYEKRKVVLLHSSTKVLMLYLAIGIRDKLLQLIGVKIN